MSIARRALAGAAMLILAAPAVTRAQDTAKTVKVVTPALDFSGVIFGNYGYKTDSAAKAGLGGQNPNGFNIDRVYLTFRMPVGDHASIRATTDIFNGDQSSASYYKGWTVRLKYGYLQYVLPDLGDVKGMNLTGHIGMLHTVLIDHEELFWPRYLSQVATDRNGFFSSADLGVAGLLTLPNKWGEIYGTVVNGNGYTAAESDRFKDFALRVTFTPLAEQEMMDGYFKTFAISPWFSKGYAGSKFASGGTGQTGAVTDALTKDRWGVFVGNRDRRLTFGAEYGNAKTASEGGANTFANPRTVAEANGQLISAFAIVRPFEWADAKQKSQFGVLGRIDQYKPNTNSSSTSTNTSSSYDRFIIGGVFWELTPKVTLSLDYQGRTPQSGSSNVDQTTYFLHWVANF
ncbi:MAG: hypothetical protein ABJD07_08190 [Gemmatimonadaceae bacterium]